MAQWENVDLVYKRFWSPYSILGGDVFGLNSGGLGGSVFGLNSDAWDPPSTQAAKHSCASLAYQ